MTDSVPCAINTHSPAYVAEKRRHAKEHDDLPGLPRFVDLLPAYEAIEKVCGQ